MTSELLHSDKLVFSAYLIWISGSHYNPTVRMLLVTNANIQAVYEGWGSWSIYRYWIGRLLYPDEPKLKLRLAKKILVRNRFVSFQELRIPLYELASQGFHRVDR
jgi:hypothetical protein